jgi:ABC-type glycerol-3-phosphate transport system substrate-binding protein
MIPQENQMPFWANVVEAGWLKPWSDYADFADFRSTFPETAFAEGNNMRDGNVYTGPLFLSLPWLQLYINTSLYREAGLVNEDGSLPLPTTWDEMLANSRAIKEATGAYGMGFGGTTNNIDWFWWTCQLSGPYFADLGGGWNPATATYEFSERPCFRQMIDYLITFRDEELMLPESMSIDDETVRVLFATNEVAHYFAGSWVINGWATTNPDFTDYTAVRLPLIGVDEPISRFYTNPGGRFLGINANTEHADAAWEFVKFIYGPEFGRIFAESGNGLTLFTPGDRSEYATNDAWANIYAMGDMIVTGPSAVLRRPELSQVVVTLQGPNPAQVLTGIYTGQITDIDAALADLDERFEAALDQGIADAQGTGLEVTRDDYLFPDWNPAESYVPASDS